MAGQFGELAWSLGPIRGSRSERLAFQSRSTDAGHQARRCLDTAIACDRHGYPGRLCGHCSGPPALAKDWQGDGHWVGTWSASPQRIEAPIQINGQTLRQIVRTSVSGTHVRVRLSNAYGTSPLVIGAAHVALSAGGSSIVERTDRTLKFSGSPTVTIPAGALAVSDSVKLEVPPLGDVAVSLYLPTNANATTQHEVGLQTTYISDAGNFSAASTVVGTTTQSYYFLTGVEVRASERATAIVTLGDSVTDGFASTPDMNQRWPNLLAERLQAHWRGSRVAVLNAGVSGNRILHHFVGTGAAARLDRDVLVQTFWTAAMEENVRPSTVGFARATRTMPSLTSTRYCAIRCIPPVCCPNTTAVTTCIRRHRLSCHGRCDQPETV